MNLTGYLLIAVSVVLLVYDGVCPHYGLPTESQVIRDTAWAWNVLPFIIGTIVGHWFFPGFGITKSSAFGNLIPFWFFVLVMDFVFNGHGYHKYPGIWLLAGMPLGALVLVYLFHKDDL